MVIRFELVRTAKSLDSNECWNETKKIRKKPKMKELDEFKEVRIDIIRSGVDGE